MEMGRSALVTGAARGIRRAMAVWPVPDGGVQNWVVVFMINSAENPYPGESQ
jgi:hypothetical protein